MKNSVIASLRRHMGQGVSFDITPKTLDLWNPGIQAASDGGNDIGIYDVIGEDYWGDGVSAKRISAALRSIGDENPVDVYINSPGGDLFEGLAIYNLLKDHAGQVTVKIVGMAASAASIIAMGADRLEISRAGFLMIHNTWIVVAGNRLELRDYADYLEPFDQAMTDIYHVRSGVSTSDIESMMDKETWIGGASAIDQGFAEDYLPSDQVDDTKASASKIAAHKIDVALAKAGMSRSERRKLVGECNSGTQNAADSGTPRATDDTPRAIELKVEPLSTLKFNY